MDAKKFEEIKQVHLKPMRSNALGERHVPVKSYCTDCERMVVDRRVHFYVREFGTENQTWVKKCVTPCSQIIDKTSRADRDFWGLT